MSKKELYTWLSLGMSLSVLVYYLITFWGWPDGIPDFSSTLNKVFFNIFIISLIGQTLLELTGKDGTVEEDERDIMIAYRGYKNAYKFLSVVVVLLFIQIGLSDFIGVEATIYGDMAGITFIMHVLFAGMIISSIIKSGTDLFFYRRDF